MKHYNRFYTELGVLIQEKRKEKSLKQIDLAKLMNVTPITISRWETGSSRIPNDITKQICQLLEIDYDTLIHNANERVIQAKENDILNVTINDSIRIPLYDNVPKNKPFSEIGLNKFITISAYLLNPNKTYFAFNCNYNTFSFNIGEVLIFERCSEFLENDIVFAFINDEGCITPAKIALVGKYEVVGVLRRAVKDYTCQ